MKTRRPRKWLRDLRDAKGLTQAQVAAEIGGITYQAVSSWENGSKTPSRTHMFSLAKLLGPDVLRRLMTEGDTELVDEATARKAS